MHRGIGIGSIHRAGNNVYDGKIAGLYDLEETLGRGHFAVVKLARHVFTGEKVAVKVIDKSKLDEVSRSHLFQEVRCMKLVQHPNVVRLYEVIDTQTKLYLILELGDGGDLYDYIMRHETGLTEQVARDYFRQIVRAISYCHRLHVVHRDLKPENVVFFEKLGMVKLTDFGFSNKFDPGQKLETSCGSLAYSAPEILLGDSYDAPAVDVWSLGVILYMLVCGQAPFQEANDSETLTMIMDCKYTIPAHVSNACKMLIGRMLVRAPERRATLQQIANDPWLGEGAQTEQVEYLPLVSRQQVSEEDHNLIIQKIVNGNIATKEEIQEALDRNEYNHITATYFLLAERKLRAHRQEQIQRKRPEQLSITTQGAAKTTRTNDLLQVGNNNLPNPSLLTVPRTPGDLPQRARKCSIVQEEEDEEDLSGCSGREELATTHCSLNRRGSRSEGRLNIALQERIAESERRREALKKPIVDTTVLPKETKSATWKPIKVENTIGEPAKVDQTKWRVGPKPSLVVNTLNSKSVDSVTPKTTILNESSTITIPVHTSPRAQVIPKYKTMPTSVLTPNLVEIFEEGSDESGVKRNFVNRKTGFEQRRTKFHKARTASCSSSDASDDDSENRKKRAHNNSGKPLPARRDSHDDSSDSQDQGGCGGGGAGSGGAPSTGSVQRSGNTQSNQVETSKTTNSGNQSNNRKHTVGNRRTGRRRSGETRLRESQSLNRITEVQEEVVISPKTKSFGARLLQSWTKNKEEKENYKLKIEKVQSKKLRLLGRYFQVHKKLCLPGIFGRGRIYKAQSCSSLQRDRITSPTSTVHIKDRPVTSALYEVRSCKVVGSDSDINRNNVMDKENNDIVPFKSVCNHAVHLDNMKPCQLC